MDTNNEAQENKGAADQSNWHGLDLKSCNLQQFVEVATGNVEAKKDYLENPDKFKELNERFEREAMQSASAPEQPGSSAPSSSAAAQPQPGQAPAGGGQPAAGAAQPQQEQADELVELKIPKKLLGTYLTGRTDNDGVIEALKGKLEADKTLKEWGQERLNLRSETATLRQQLLDATIGRKTAEAQPKAAPSQPFQKIEVEEVDFSALENADLFNPDSHDTIKAGIKKAAAAYNAIKQAIATTQAAATAQPSPEVKPFNPDADPEVVAQRQQIEYEQQQRDIIEVDATVSQIPQLRMSKPFRDVDLEVSAFYDKLKAASGIPGDRMEAVKFYYGSTPESKVFRDRCVANGLVPPADIDKHAVAVRAYQKYTSAQRAVPLADFIAIEVSKLPPPAEQPPAPAVPPAGQQQQSYKERIEQHNRQAQANSTPPGYIPDIPPSVGSQSGFQLSEAEQNMLVQKAYGIMRDGDDPTSITVAEAKWLVDAGVNHSRILARSKQ